jgi:hypothetical protein
MCDHVESPNPRLAGTCVKCSRPLPKPARDLHYERIWFEQLADAAERQFGVNIGAYIPAVRERLRIGAERYGDDDFLGKKVIEQLLEETPDVAAYCLLEIQKMLLRNEDDEGKMFHLFECAKHAAAADWHARQA